MLKYSYSRFELEFRILEVSCFFLWTSKKYVYFLTSVNLYILVLMCIYNNIITFVYITIIIITILY